MPSAARSRYAVVYCNMPDVEFLVGEFTVATPPVIVTGKGYSVTRQSQGVFRVTPNQEVGHFIGPTANLCKLNATTEARFLNGVVTADGNNYVDFRIEDATGAAQDGTATDTIKFNIPMMINRLPIK